MAEVFDTLAVYGISRDDEAVILATLLTGEPCLLVGAPGASKTRISRSLAKAMGVTFHSYNAACDQFEDIIGFLNMKALGEGKVEYVTTPVTVWDKRMVSVEELNRPDATTESKWLDFFAEGTMMGVPTGVRWRFATMNPFGTVGTRELGEATLGRFSAFVFVPEMADMSSGERESIIQTIADTSLPALTHWTLDHRPVAEDGVDYQEAGELVNRVIRQAADHFTNLLEHAHSLDRFLVKLIGALAQTSKETRIRIDGRRAGLMRRLALAVRAVELARANVFTTEPKSFQECVRVAVRAGLPIGVNEEGGRTRGSLAHLEGVMASLMGYLSDVDATTLEMQYELLTTNNLFRKAELLIEHADKLDTVIASAVWAKIVRSHEFNASLVGLMANQIEMVAPGTIPSNAMDGLTKLMNRGAIVPRVIRIPPVMRQHATRIREMLEQPTMVGKLVAAHVVSERAALYSESHEEISASVIDELETTVKTDVKKSEKFGKVVERLLRNRPVPEEATT